MQRKGLGWLSERSSWVQQIIAAQYHERLFGQPCGTNPLLAPACKREYAPLTSSLREKRQGRVKAQGM